MFWDEDLSDSSPDDYDPYLDLLPEYRDFDDEDDDGGVPQEQEDALPQGEPLWSVKLELNNGSDKEITFYNRLHSEPQELYWTLMDFLESDDFEDELIDQ